MVYIRPKSIFFLLIFRKIVFKYTFIIPEIIYFYLKTRIDYENHHYKWPKFKPIR